jgi:hypothetical protein
LIEELIHHLCGEPTGESPHNERGESWTDASYNLPAGSVVKLKIDLITLSTLYAVACSASSFPAPSLLSRGR